MDPRFRVDLIAATPNPQQCVYAAMHQDYSEGFVAADRDDWPDEQRAGEICVKRLLAGERGHYGPLEHAQIVLNVGWFPHSVMQQARTHRVGVSFDVQCLAADTEITFVSASGALHKIRIADLYDRWMQGEPVRNQQLQRGGHGERPGDHRRRCRLRLQRMRLRVLNEETGWFDTSHIKDVLCSGIQPVYRLTMEDGRRLDCTANHRLLTPQGWQTMAAALSLRTDAEGRVRDFRRTAQVLANGTVAAGTGAYRNAGWLQGQLDAGASVADMAERAGCAKSTIRKWVRRSPIAGLEASRLRLADHQAWGPHQGVHGQQEPRPRGGRLRAHPLTVARVEFLGEQITYDLEVQDPWHNFVANGLVVHNSMRYTGDRICKAAKGELELEEVFYLRPTGSYSDRQGKKYDYDETQRAIDLQLCQAAAERYRDLLDAGFAEEHARGILPFDYRQHFVVSFSLRALLHFLDLRAKLDAQQEIRSLCDLLWPHLQAWTPQFAEWYEKSRLHRARLAP